VEFFYVYKALAHPQKDGYVQPLTDGERVLHVKEAKRRLDTKMPWLADSISNDLKHAFGDRNNSEFVIGPDGKIEIARSWSAPDELRQDLERLVGRVDKPTKISDLDREPQAAPKIAASGIVKPIDRPGDLVAVKAKPKLSLKNTQPLYAKLRAEAQQGLLSGGSGKLLLGFHLDPIYNVHWNNLAAPIKFSIAAGKSTTVTPANGTGPKVEEESDVDPREFLIEIDGADTSKPFILKVDYFACNDAEGWCKAVSQEYEITLERNPDAGRVMAGRGGGGGRRPQRGGAGGGRRPDPAQMITRMMESDTDGDGKISRKEAPERMAERFDQMDTNGDGFVEKSEIEKRFQGRAPRR